MSGTTTVERLSTAGFHIGPAVDDPCGRCPHRWGDHILYAPIEPVDGGTVSCPECGCTGTWGVPQAQAARERLKEAREGKDRE